ncbi:MAG: lipid kinase [Candidatus Eremiobacteraeota bacterium]|nr:lipid kinase [Candidatus Eremiobacteraeota bacterium]MBV8365516.1 lipid kinase [Candidatus Eremiobacteraeota bacterium]
MASTQPVAAALRGMRALLLVNPQARLASEHFDLAIDVLKNAGFALTCPDIEDKHSVAAAFERHARGSDLVIVGGGDGSLHYALQHLMKYPLPLGILPLGTANDLAKSLGIPLGLEEASAVIARGATRRIDVGCVNGTYFFSEMSIGLSPMVARLLSKDLKARLGVVALAYRAFQVMRRMQRFAASVNCDGHEYVLRSAQLTIGNSRSFGGFIANDEARIDDHRLDLYSVSFRYWWSYLEAVRALLARRYDEARSVETMHGARFEIRTKRPKAIEADGEIVSMTPATVNVVPSAVAVFVPEQSA